MVKPWMLDELAHIEPEHLDPGFSSADGTLTWHCSGSPRPPSIFSRVREG